MKTKYLVAGVLSVFSATASQITRTLISWSPQLEVLRMLATLNWSVVLPATRPVRGDGSMWIWLPMVEKPSRQLLWQPS